MSGLRLAHVGIVVADIHAFARTMAQVLSAEPVSAVVQDENQQALLQMFRSGGTYLEVIAPATPDSHVHTVLKNRGEGLVHLCFETDDLDGALARIREQGALVFRGPEPAALFGNRRVAFAMLPNRMIVELVEQGWQEGLKTAAG